MQAVSCSWPSIRAAGDQVQTTVSRADLTYAQLQRWLNALIVDDDGLLVISSDTFHLLPGQLPYEVLGPLILAAVDGPLSQAAEHQQLEDIQHKRALQEKQHVAEAGAALQKRVQQLGLRLTGVDLQQPVVGPLKTCIAAYSCLQQLSLHELNIDVSAAQALGSILSSSSGGGCNLRSITLDGTFMCDMAWQALCTGLATGCELQSIRLHHCLCAASLAVLAAALPVGCLQLSELDLSDNKLAQTNASGINSANCNSTIAADADTAWSQLFQALQGCRQLQLLSAQRCSLGPKAAAAIAQILKARYCSLRQLSLAQCINIGNAPLSQLTAVAAYSNTLEQLNLSGLGLADANIKPLTQAPGWISKGRSERQLRQLDLSGNLLTAAAVSQLGKALTSGGTLSGLASLSLAGCHAIGNEGAIALSTALTGASHQLTSLDLSSCELADRAVEALTSLIAPVPVPCTAVGSSYRSPLHSPFKMKIATCATEQKGAGLRTLRLVDNQITAKGIHTLARALSDPCCSLHLLDVSWNWVGPEGMSPLIQAADTLGTAQVASSIDLKAAAAAGCYLQQQHVQQQPRCIMVLRECLPEYWRVEAAKAATLHTETSDQHAHTPAAGAGSRFGTTIGFASSSTFSGSCCSMAGSIECGSLSASEDSEVAVMTPDTAETVTTCGINPDKQQLWVFNTLYSTEGGSSPQSSRIAVGVETCSDVCNHYADSDVALSQSSSECNSPTGSGCSIVLYSSNSSSHCAVNKHDLVLAPADSTSSVFSNAESSMATVTAATCSIGSAADTAAEIAGNVAVAVMVDESRPGSAPDAPASALHGSGGSGMLGQHAAGTSLDQQPRVKSPARSSIAAVAHSSNTGAEFSSRLSHTCHITRGCMGAVTPAPTSAKKLLPKPPTTANPSHEGCISVRDVSGGSWLAAPLGAPVGPTPGLKTLRNLRRRVTELGAAGSLRVTAADNQALQERQPGAEVLSTDAALHLKRSCNSSSSTYQASATRMGQKQQQTKAVASSRSVVTISAGLGTVGHAPVSPVNVQQPDHDSCALKDCAPVVRRNSALPSVSA